MNTFLLGLLNGPEVVVILVLALVLFGSKRLPEFAKSLGQGLREFKKATNDVTDNLQNALYESEHTAPKQLPAAPDHTVNATAVAGAPAVDPVKTESAASPVAPVAAAPAEPAPQPPARS